MLKAVDRQAEEAEAILRQEHELPKPGLLVSKSNYQQALMVIERHKQALAEKNQVQARNRYLEAQQANFERKIAAVEQESADKIRWHEEALQAVKRELRQGEESRRAIMEHYSRELKGCRRLKEEDDARKKTEREREMFERSQRTRTEAQERARERLAASESKSPEPPAATPPEPEKKPGFTLGR